MRNQTLTIMFTDMKGFTPRTSRQSRAATIDLIKQQKELILPTVVKYGGRLIKSIGDAFLLTFESSTDAVLAGIALQSKMEHHNAASEEDQQLEIRVAIHTGEVTIDEGDIYGEAVNIASRIEGIAEANEVYFTEATYLSMNRAEVPSAEIGYRILKGIPQKVKVFKVLKEDENLAGLSAGRGAPSLHALILPPPAWRRVLAFTLDVMLVWVLVLILCSEDLEKIKKSKESLAEEAKRLSAALGENHKRFVKAFLSGEKEPPKNFPHYAEIQQFRENRTRLQKAGRQSPPEEVSRLEEENERLAALFREASKERIDQALWGDGPLRANMPLASEITAFREKRKAAAALQRDRKGGMRFLGVLLFVVYTTVCVGWKGRTLGKKLFGLRVLRADDSDVGWGKAFVRSLLYLVSALPLFLGFVWAFFDKQRQGWHDKITDTKVSYLPKA